MKEFSGLEYYSSIRPGKIAGDTRGTAIRSFKYSKDTETQYKLNFDADWYVCSHKQKPRKM
ncbi:hypothetical protein ABEB36_004515 [Hypothenemus hampei]|uniref:Uncharacterized protein n=1 Tax=Hypothenemus hampei TaxID=57062 RepID=A0ABD1F3L3_HYPHA